MSDDGQGLLVAEQAEPWCPHTDITEAGRAHIRRLADESPTARRPAYPAAWLPTAVRLRAGAGGRHCVHRIYRRQVAASPRADGHHRRDDG